MLATMTVGAAPIAQLGLLGAPAKKVTAAVSLCPANAAVTVTFCSNVVFNVTEHVPAAVVVHVVPLNV